MDVPVNSSAARPIIIIGMHRSGTSLIARVLEQQGLFLGKRKQRNHEAMFFLRLNTWLLRQSGGAWDQPEPIHFLVANQRVRALVVGYLHFMLRSPRIMSYLGWSDYLRYRSPYDFPRPWGWKDPRTTYTLPVWLELFPEAKVVHVYRHGVDVSHSLRTRMLALLDRGQAGHEKIGKRFRVYWVYARRAGFTDSLRCAASLEDSFTLWESYMREAHIHVQNLAERCIEIQYEQFLADPHSGLMQLARFCDLDVTEDAAARLSGQLDATRAYAYRQEPELTVFAHSVTDRLAEWGYGV